LRDAGAARITLVAPYLCYARKDRRSQPRDPVSLRYLAQVVEAMGISRVVTCDVHNLAPFQNAFRIPTEDLSAISLFAPALAERVGPRPVAVVAPDSGGMLRAEALRGRLERVLGRPVARAIMEKRRSGGIVSGDHLAGDVADRVAVLVDDLISTGTTLDRAVRACRAHGASAVYACATHGLFTAQAASLFAAMPLDGLLITDTVSGVPLPAALGPRLQQLSAAPLVAAAIRRLHAGRSLNDLLG
jgi:ribose-phosphate pyrophosphokinase